MRKSFYTVGVLVSAAVVLLLLGVDRTLAKKEFTDEPADVTIVHQKTQETNVLRAITTKERIECSPSLLARLGFVLKDDQPQPECFRFEGSGGLLREATGVCTEGTNDGRTCSTNEDAAACRAGGGECAVVLVEALSLSRCSALGGGAVVSGGRTIGVTVCADTSDLCVCTCGIEDFIRMVSRPTGLVRIPNCQGGMVT